MGLKKWPRALLFLEIVITSPTSNNISMIQVEAFKKWILVSLLMKGSVSGVFQSSNSVGISNKLPKAVTLPRTTNSHATKLYRSLTKAYAALAEAFKEGISKETTARRLLLEIDAGHNVWLEVRYLMLIALQNLLNKALINV